MDWSSFIAGAVGVPMVYHIIKWLTSRWEPPAPPAPPDRAFGDIVQHADTGMPVVLLNKLTHDRYEACFITPRAKRHGAHIGNREQKLDELEIFFAYNVHNRDLWPDYPYDLSDGESANFAQATLK